MRLLVYEYLTGGGLWSEPTVAATDHPLLAEGRCMVEAICEDLARIEDVELIRFRDARLINSTVTMDQTVPIRGVGEERAQLTYWSGRVDGVLLIAPEHNQRLLERCDLVRTSGGRLISPDKDFVELTSNKHATALHLASAGVATPQAIFAHVPSSALPIAYPVVVKPVDGVGSLDTYLVENHDQWSRLAGKIAVDRSAGWRIEQFHAGTPVSVSALCGPRGHIVLPPCHQSISDDGRLRYLGGEYPLTTNLVHRVCQLAHETLNALPPTRGYVGIDMILSANPALQPDVVLDVNPRLTTSYVGLRRAAVANLAQAMLTIAQGQSCPVLFHGTRIQFDCQGNTIPAGR